MRESTLQCPPEVFILASSYVSWLFVDVVTICLRMVFLMLSEISGHAAVELVGLSFYMRLVARAIACVIDSCFALEKLSTADLQSSRLGALS